MAHAAEPPTIDNLLGQLQENRPSLNAAEVEQLDELIKHVPSAVAEGNFDDVIVFLTSVKTHPLGTNKKTAALIEQLIAAVAAQDAAEDAKLAAKLESILSEANAKFAAHAGAVEIDPLLKRLVSIPVGRGQSGQYAARQVEQARALLMRYQDYLLATEHGKLDQADVALNDLVRLAGEMRMIPRSQLLALQTRATARTDEIAAQIETLRKQAVALIDSARTAADFDPVLQELAKPIIPDSLRGTAGNLYNQVEMLRRYVHRWQDYFSQLEARNPAAAKTLLRELANDNSMEATYPRSRILARLRPAEMDSRTGDQFVTAETLTLDTLENFHAQVVVRQAANGRGDVELESLVSESANLLSVVNDLKLGNPRPAVLQTRVLNTNIRSGPYALAFGRMSLTLLQRALPIYIAAPDDLKVGEQESVDTYLRRVIRRSRDEHDWQLVYRALEASQMLNLNINTAPFAADLSGYKLFFTGMNQERAEQWIAAVRAYQAALKSDSVNLPSEEIGARLKKLKEEHPQDYEAAEKPAEVDVRRNFPGGAVRPGGAAPVSRGLPGRTDPLLSPPPANPTPNQPTAPAGASTKPPGK